MSLRLKGDIWHYRFSLRGRRHEGSTGETKENRARLVESDKMREAMESRLNPLFRKLGKENLAEDIRKSLGAYRERSIGTRRKTLRYVGELIGRGEWPEERFK